MRFLSNLPKFSISIINIVMSLHSLHHFVNLIHNMKLFFSYLSCLLNVMFILWKTHGKFLSQIFHLHTVMLLVIIAS